MRRAAACSTISPVVCVVVQSLTIPFHSSLRAMRVASDANSAVSSRSGRSMRMQNDSHWSRVLVLNPTQPSRVGSIEGISTVRYGTEGSRSGRPARELNRSA